MKISKFILLFNFISILFIMSSCSAIVGIFKAGMGFGIFVVIAVLVIIVGIVAKNRAK